VILYADTMTGSMERAIAETNRRREKQVEYNTANGITPASIKRSIHDIMNSVYERDHVLVEVGGHDMTDDIISIGHNFETVLADLETRMREAAADLNFEEAARLRDEVKRLRATELAVVDDPTAKQRSVQDRAGAYAGAKKYGDAANLPAAIARAEKFARRGGASSPSPRSSRGEGRGEGLSPTSGARGGAKSQRDPLLPSVDEVLSDKSASSKVRKPHLDEMHGPESLPYRPSGARPSKPAPVGGTKIFQPTDSRQSGPEFGPAPRSTGGAPGKRGGWKKR
jgi:excinuclease ABC subunit B